MLHISDIHLTPGRHRLMAFVRSLASLEPDLVVNTGDSIASPDAIGPLLDSLGPLLDGPACSSTAPTTCTRPSRRTRRDTSGGPARATTSATSPTCPGRSWASELTAAGWLDLNNRRGRLTVNGLDIAFGGVHDPHGARDRYDQVAGPG